MFLSLMLLLTGCSVFNEFYLSNYTNTNVTVRITFGQEVNEIKAFDAMWLAAGPIIETVKSNSKQNLKELLAYQIEGKHSVQFVLPAHNTVYLGSTISTKRLFSQMELESGCQQLTINRGNFSQYFETEDRLIGAIVHVLNLNDQNEENC